jgi:hypothetical protein
MLKNLICPISPLRINENVARVTALLVAALVVLYAFTHNVYIVLFLIVDFYIRGFTSLKVSPLSWLAIQINKGLQLPVILTDKAKKIFAARVGFLFSLAILILFYIHPLSSVLVGLVLTGFALLEGVLNICVGCLVYTYFVFPLFKGADREVQNL